MDNSGRFVGVKAVFRQASSPFSTSAEGYFEKILKTLSIYLPFMGKMKTQSNGVVMGQPYRDAMEKLIEKCSGTGKLDLKELRHEMDKLATQIMVKTDEYQYDTHDAGTSLKLKNSIIKDLSVATREVLGIIPKDKWNHDGEGFFDDLFKDHPDPKTKLIPIKKPKQDDPTKSLAEQGYEFATVEYLIKNQKSAPHKDGDDPHHGLQKMNAQGKSQGRH